MQAAPGLVHTLPLNKVTKSCCDAKMQPSVKLNNPQRNPDQEVFFAPATFIHVVQVLGIRINSNQPTLVSLFHFATSST